MKAVWMRYRAACIPHQTGCRQCGKAISEKRATCSHKCCETFDSNHFWSTARWHALRRACPPDWKGVFEKGAICARCGGLAQTVRGEVRQYDYGIHEWRMYPTYWAPEVNHKTPLNGNRPHFGCCHHQDNLEVLCHACHLQVGAEQRAAGLIGKLKQISLLGIQDAMTALAGVK